MLFRSSDGVGDCLRRRHQCAAGRGANRSVIEGYGESIRRFDHAGMDVKALSAWPARAAPDRFLRIELRFTGHLVEQFTHSFFGFCLAVVCYVQDTTGIDANKASL